ncbi:MAG: dephospho-CoA kinase [Sphingobacteriales bacterium]|nr:dephospho-CoA kinase [Sphingobacteriales bacterium]
MLRIGLTGGIGSGKTTVAKVFETLGIPVYYADIAGKRLMNEDEELKEAVIKNFGSESYTDGKLNSAYIASVVFTDKEKLELLNSLVHPATIRDAQVWMGLQTAPYAIKEAALIFESGSGAELDFIIGVYAPQALRIKRTMERDKISREEVIKRMHNQVDEELKMKLCDFVIYNDEQQLVIAQVLELHERFLKEAQQR